ncbi:PREDICTED: C3 and PZP-like alpha-2-macroglobulin domain-containing protein 8 [Papilio xuthus]|uniref:TEP1-F n=1 Tax=Papilio xuthus TaxID=66420 RepID=A0AAJ6ZXM4_PAPXU|nr:PREDICTED: C3 and PZP-like alpha-2-macroglobulin domain-containing protein 8 [Papilio xuthus]
MSTTITVCCFFFILTTSGFVTCLSVVGPRVLRPHTSYKVSIAGSSRAHNLYVAVEREGGPFSQGREVQVPAATSRLLELDIGDPGPGRYRLVARSTSGPQFASSAPLLYQPRSFCVFVQTDKRVYKPEDTINFRVIALDKYLLPLNTSVDVSILDAGGAAIREWAAAPLDRGLFADTLALADQPALGEWTIQVEVRGQKYSQRILVADYVLPKFQMEMKMPKEILFSDGKFNINVTAKHFNGLPVQGELTISAYAVFFSGVLQPVFSTPARKVVDLNGQAEVTFDLKTDLDLAEDAARPLVVEAVLEEKYTLIRQNISSRILLLRTPYRLKVTAPDYFKPQLPYVVQIEVVNSSGQVMDTEGDVMVEQLWDDGAPANRTTVSFRKGLAIYETVPDAAHNNSTMNLVIKYKEVTERVVNVVSGSGGGAALSVQLLSAAGDSGELSARIAANEPMDLLHYALVARGDILLAETLELNPGRRTVEVRVPVGRGAAPGCVLLAWAPRLDPAHPLLAAGLYLPHDKLLYNQVSVSTAANSGQYRPNGMVEVRAAGGAGARVALLAAPAHSHAAGLAGPLGNGLDLHTIEREVESFSGVRHSVFRNEERAPGLGLDLAARDPADVFKNAGLVILTDGIVVENDPTGEQAERAAAGLRPALAGPYAFSRLPAPPSPRVYLSVTPHPTWMFSNLTLDKDGKGAMEVWSPATPGEWSIGAFSVHPTLGLGLAAPQVFVTGVPLSLTAELPDTLQRGETLAVVIILQNSMPSDVTVEVTFHNSDQYFEFEPLENTVEATKKIELFRRVRVSVGGGAAASTAFLVSAVRAGSAPVIVEASGGGLSASLFRTIDVQDGYEEEVWSWTLLDGRRSAARGNVSVWAAAGTRLSGSALLAAGDLLAPALRGLRDPPPAAADPAYALRPLATACILLDYLQTTNQDEVSITKDARGQAAAGYQRLMAYRRPDGSFAQELDPEAGGDVYMTAVSGRWVSRCARHVAAAPAGGAAARWLAQAQLPDGSWPAPTQARNDPHAQRPLPLAAHAVLALLDAKGSEVLYKEQINKGVEYVARGLAPDLDAYALAAAASALAAARHPQAGLALQMMDKYVNSSDSTLFWSRKLHGSEWRNPWLVGNSLEARAAACGLRALLAARHTERALPVARYLLQHLRPEHVHPDVLDALAQFSEAIKTSKKLRVSVNVTGFEEPRQFNIDDDNALIIQTQLVRSARWASAVTEGRGVALLGLSARGASNVTAAWPRYTLDPRVDRVSTEHRLQLSICVGFVAQGNDTESGLALLTVQLPSGFLADINTITELTSARHVVGARLQRSGARVLAWLRAGRAERCATLAAPRVLPAARQRPGWADLVDLADSSHRARVFFSAVSSSACSVCRAWPSCERACGAAALQRAPDRNNVSGAPGAPAAPGQGNPNSAPALHTTLTPIFLTALLLMR